MSTVAALLSIGCRCICWCDTSYLTINDSASTPRMNYLEVSSRQSFSTFDASTLSASDDTFKYIRFRVPCRLGYLFISNESTTINSFHCCDMMYRVVVCRRQVEVARSFVKS
jgi:hypothetical protein